MLAALVAAPAFLAYKSYKEIVRPRNNQSEEKEKETQQEERQHQHQIR